MPRLYRGPSVPAKDSPEYESALFDPSKQTADEVNQYLATAGAEERRRVLKEEKGSRKRSSVLEGPHAVDEQVNVGGTIPPGSNSPALSAGGTVDGADSANMAQASAALADQVVNPVVPLPGDTTIPAAVAEAPDAKSKREAEAAQREAEAEQARADKAAEKDAAQDAKATQERADAEAKATKAADAARAAERGATSKTTQPRR
jgi:hypothetical protein